MNKKARRTLEELVALTPSDAWRANDSEPGQWLSIFVSEDITSKVEELARFLGINPSEYIRQAILEMNERENASRIISASRSLRALNAEDAASLDDAASDGLHGT